MPGSLQPIAKADSLPQAVAAMGSKARERAVRVFSALNERSGFVSLADAELMVERGDAIVTERRRGIRSIQLRAESRQGTAVNYDRAVSCDSGWLVPKRVKFTSGAKDKTKFKTLRSQSGQVIYRLEENHP